MKFLNIIQTEYYTVKILNIMHTENFRLKFSWELYQFIDLLKFVCMCVYAISFFLLSDFKLKNIFFFRFSIKDKNIQKYQHL